MTILLKKKAPGVFDYGGRVVYMSCVHGGGVYIQWAVGCSDKSTPRIYLGWGYILRLKPNIVYPLFSRHDCTLLPHSAYVRHHSDTYLKTFAPCCPLWKICFVTQYNQDSDLIPAARCYKTILPTYTRLISHIN